MQAVSWSVPVLAAAPITQRLTSGEVAVLVLMAEGHSNAGIARQLGLSHRTVECHVSRVFDKLALPQTDEGWNRRVLAVRWWLQVTPDVPAAPADPPVAGLPA